jgi:hypothetical protein
MGTDTKKPLNRRAFVALTAAISGVGLPVTGIANHLFQMEPMTLQRHAWMSAHNALGVLFTTFVVWHTVLNRRTLLNHARGLGDRLFSMSREASFAVALIAVTLFLVVGHAFHIR